MSTTDELLSFYKIPFCTFPSPPLQGDARSNPGVGGCDLHPTDQIPQGNTQKLSQRTT